MSRVDGDGIIPSGLIPFDLQFALSHIDQVRTRNGRKIIYMAYSEGATEDNRIAVLLDDTKRWTPYYGNGMRYKYQPSSNDLFLLAPQRAVKIAYKPIVRYADGTSTGTRMFDTKREAEDCGRSIERNYDKYKFISVATVTWEEETI